MTLEQRFWLKVNRRGPDECRPWTGSRNSQGYGQIRSGGRGPPVLAHRLAWELANGKPLPLDMDACHHCDSPPCCNPAHIWPGTAAENSADMVMKGRAPHRAGRVGTKTKLTAADVIEIRRIREDKTETATALAHRFGVRISTISDITHRHYWKHIP